MGYRLAGYAEFTFQLDIPAEQAQDGSFKRFADALKDAPGWSPYVRLLPGSAGGEALQAMIAEQTTLSWYLRYAGPVIAVSTVMAQLDELCREHFPRVH